MPHLLRAAIIVAPLAFLYSCASTSLSSYTDPAFVGSTFDSVAIWADTNDMEWRQDLETRMQQRVTSKTGAQASRLIDIAPPTRGYSVDETFQLLLGAGIQGVIVVTFTDTGINQTISGNEYGVQTYEKPWGAASVDLYHVESGVKAWTGSASTRGNAFADWDDIRNSAGNKVIAELLDRGLLPPPTNKDPAD